MKTYGQIIKQARTDRALSGRRLAERVGISETHLRNIENGRRQTTPQTLQNIARSLSMNPSPLINAWIEENLEGVDYNPSLLQHVYAPDMDGAQIETMYGIDRARAAYDKIKTCTTGAKMKDLDPETLLEVRVALKNCLGMIDDLIAVE
jgi:transcriptional regulator with XRE-family HTH domain